LPSVCWPALGKESISGVPMLGFLPSALYDTRQSVLLCRVPEPLHSLPESGTLPSAGRFAECLLSGTRQSRLCPTLPRAALGEFLLSVTSWFAECGTLGTGELSAKVALGKGPSAAVIRLTDVSLCRGPRLGTRQRGFFAECLFWTLGKAYFYFLDFVHQTFCSMFLHYVDLHVSFVDNYNRVFNR
jgi:hypothetical protein